MNIIDDHLYYAKEEHENKMKTKFLDNRKFMNIWPPFAVINILL